MGRPRLTSPLFLARSFSSCSVHRLSPFRPVRQSPRLPIRPRSFIREVVPSKVKKKSIAAEIYPSSNRYLRSWLNSIIAFERSLLWQTFVNFCTHQFRFQIRHCVFRDRIILARTWPCLIKSGSVSCSVLKCLKECLESDIIFIIFSKEREREQEEQKYIIYLFLSFFQYYYRFIQVMIVQNLLK